MTDTSNGHASDELAGLTSSAADPRRKLELFVKTVVGSKAMQESGGMMSAVLTSAMPMVTTMLGRAAPETVSEYCTVLSKAFAQIADGDVSEEVFAAQLASWRPNE